MPGAGRAAGNGLGETGWVLSGLPAQGAHRMPGSVTKPKANPESLFAAGYAACFSSALNAAARGHRHGRWLTSASIR